jgi:hypothetical protein
MSRSALALPSVAVLLIASAAVARAADAPADRDAAALAATIDKLIAEHWKAKNVTPAPAADDAQFLRRVTLDLNGRIPAIVSSASDRPISARDFIENPDPDKRAKLVRMLLADERYPAHFAAVWRDRLFPRNADPQRGFFPAQVDPPLRKFVKENAPYDRLVRDLVLARGDLAGQFFYQAAENKPEVLAGNTARLFLGVKIECAQCHNHPFAKWTKEQFWEFTAFFNAAAPGVGGRKGVKMVVQIPDAAKNAKPHFLDGKEPNLAPGQDPREALVDWMTSAENPYFARAAINHLWEYFFGVGFIEPLDEETDDNPPSHPELLDELSKQFIAHKYDLKYMIEAIVLSKTYQLSSRETDPSQADPRLFGRARVRGLSPEQLYDSLAVATHSPSEADQGAASELFQPFNPQGVLAPRYAFLARFPNQDRRIETQTSILQALYFMNGKVVTEATSREYNKNLDAIVKNQSGKLERRIEQVFLIVLSRKPRPEERDRFVGYVEKGGPSEDGAKALADVFWVLLNTAEFATNH